MPLNLDLGWCGLVQYLFSVKLGFLRHKRERLKRKRVFPINHCLLATGRWAIGGRNHNWGGGGIPLPFPPQIVFLKKQNGDEANLLGCPPITRQHSVLLTCDRPYRPPAMPKLKVSNFHPHLNQMWVGVLYN